MSIFTDMHLDPEKPGVTLEELAHRQKLANIRHSFCEEKNGGWTIKRYYSHKGGEVVEYQRYTKANPLRLTTIPTDKMTIQIKKDYTWKVK